jgi:queuine tRNA-ribosyltransferase
LTGAIEFTVEHVDARTGARAGRLRTRRGEVETPVFMPVGTQGAFKALLPSLVAEAGATLVLGNTYHLALRPGEETVRALGGLHRMMGWDGPILTDSGGFQVFSLAPLAEIDDSGVRFRSHVDGREFFIDPERAIAIQRSLGSDIAMVLDECAPYPCERDRAEAAMRRTVRWAERSVAAHQALPDVGEVAVFGIAQGSLFEDLRQSCAAALAKLPFDGYAIGGVSVGEGPEWMDRVVGWTAPHLPGDKPRYLMGVGPPDDMLRAIGHGVDMFDCVMPTRNARGACAFTPEGKLRLRNAIHAEIIEPLDAQCGCRACRTVSRGTLRHLFRVNEMAAAIWVSLHNLTYYQALMRSARRAILADEFESFRADALARMRAPALPNGAD